MNRRERASLSPKARRRGKEAVFCGYCGAEGTARERDRGRVCRRCELGLLLSAEASLAPRPSDPFLVVDQNLHVRALSREAERVFDMSESEALTRRVSELLVPADSVSPDRFALVAALAAAARGGARASRPMAVRRPDEYGVRYSARIGPCHPGPAALLVLEPL